jgi:hypothetical protein
VLEHWETDPQSSQTGAVLKKDGTFTYFFKGDLLNKKLVKGRMVTRENGVIKLEYIGQFKGNIIDGQGVMIVPNKYRYEGSFERQKKEGIGEEVDEVRETLYIGQFSNNKRNGYGELTYFSEEKDRIKLMGFWTEGIMKAGEGVYVTKDGAFLEHFGDDLQLM